jgi:hypothetical protein
VCDTYAGWGIQIQTSIFWELLLKVNNDVFRHILRGKMCLNVSKKTEVRIDILKIFTTSGLLSY